MNALKAELDQFMGRFQSNPEPAKMYQFLEVLSAEGKLFGYSEKDWAEAARAYGLSDDEAAAWIETAASWIDDSTEGGESDPEPAFWAEEAEVRENPENPALKYGRGTEIEDCVCEETCDCSPCPCDECQVCHFCLCCCVCSEEEEDESEESEDDDREDPEDQDLGEEE